MSRIAIGIDMGGTWIKSGIVDGDGAVYGARRTRTPQSGAEDVLAAIRSEVEALESVVRPQDRLVGVGVATPGMVDDRGYLNGAAVNIAGWEELDIAAGLRRRLSFPFVVLNDANAAALGELEFGAAKPRPGENQLDEERSVALINVGTGIGCGIVLGGRPHAGHRGIAGELGHLVVRPHGRLCRCGNRGCIEAYASATGIVESARELASEYAESRSEVARRVASENQGQADPALDPEILFRLAGEGDPLAERVRSEACWALAAGVAALGTTVGPPTVVFTGGVMGSAATIMPTIRDFLRELVLPHVHRSVALACASLGSDAGLLGSGAAGLRLGA